MDSDLTHKTGVVPVLGWGVWDLPVAPVGLWGHARARGTPHATRAEHGAEIMSRFSFVDGHQRARRQSSTT